MFAAAVLLELTTPFPDLNVLLEATPMAVAELESSLP